MLVEQRVRSTDDFTRNLNWRRVNGYPTKPFEILPAKNFLTNYFLNALNEEIYNEFSSHLETVNLSVNEYLYQPGDHVDFIYFPETSVISEFQILEDGRMVEIAMTGREGIIGLLPALNLCWAENWTQVSVEGRAHRVNSQVFEKKFLHHLSFQKLLFKYTNEYVRQISLRSVCNSYHMIEQRFCSWLLMLQDRKKSNRIPLTQEQIARSLGVHRPSITHIAQTLRDKKIIDYVRGKINILNRSELEKSACVCYSEIGRHF